MRALLSLLLALTTLTANAQDSVPVMRKTPLMGWSSWNTYGVNINESLIKRQALAMKNNGYKTAGYTYVNIDDGYFGGRAADGRLLIHPTRFPNGLKPVVNYIHNLGLKAGIYSDAGHNTCGNYYNGDQIAQGVGLYEHDQEDCNMFFNELGFDFIKVDFCGGNAPQNSERLALDEKTRYTEISQAIRNTGRTDVVYNVCRWDYPGTWVYDICNSWRISHDIGPWWDSVSDIINQNLYLSAYCFDGHYNDMDMLEVGRGMSAEEDQTHFALWCIMSSPLLIGCDLTSVNATTKKLLTNKSLIALNQDSLCLQAYVAKKVDECYILVKDIEQLMGTKRAVAIYNPTAETKTVTLQFSDVCLSGTMDVTNLITQKTMGQMENSLQVQIPSHGTRVYMLQAETRTEQTRYEAETAYISDYQEIRNNQSERTGIYSADAACSGGMKAGWLGYSEQNDLLWRNVYSMTGGEYEMTIAYICGETRKISADVNGSTVSTVSVNSGSWTKVGKKTMKIQLEKGWNTIRLHNKTNWMPDIDYIDLKLLSTGIDQPSADNAKHIDHKSSAIYNLAGQPVAPNAQGVVISNHRKVIQ